MEKMVKSKSLANLDGFNGKSNLTKTNLENDGSSVVLADLLQEIEAEGSDTEAHTSCRSYVSFASSKESTKFSENSFLSTSSINFLSKRGNRDGNKTFSEDKIRDIEYKNSLLMNKIISQNRRPNQFKPLNYASKVSSHAINRKKQQDQIDYENLILLRKIQSVKPSVTLNNSKR